MNRHVLTAIALLAVAGCDYREVEREIGYKGKARVNPWLAAERFVEKRGDEVLSVVSWTPPEWNDAAWLMPATVLGNESFVRRVERWVRGGGHLILLIEYADAASHDWSWGHADPVIEPVLTNLLEDAGLRLVENAGVEAGRVRFMGEDYQVSAGSDFGIAAGDEKAGIFASVDMSAGMISVVTDARIFRSRWIGEKDHAALLAALVDASPNHGRIAFLRGTALSFWSLLGEFLAPLLIALTAWLVFWLWQHLARFGPVEAAENPAETRSYTHHLEALGHFHWKLDRAAALFGALRARVTDAAHRAGQRAGRGGDLPTFLAERSGLPQERVAAILTGTSPKDAVSLTRATADLQELLEVLEPKTAS
ncbi:MAG TPA: DUF4350 domain-containing protein [Luteolibacter sp.]|nr:DUF4350 domain-containing protein [Luteolibacter sp.]